MISGVYTTISRWTTRWYPSELQTYRGWYILKENIKSNENTTDVLYTPCYEVTDPHQAQQIFISSQKMLLLHACEDDQEQAVLFEEEQEARQYLDSRLAESEKGTSSEHVLSLCRTTSPSKQC